MPHNTFAKSPLTTGAFAILIALCLSATAGAQPLAQESADPYTRYELLDPKTAKFRIVYDVTATATGATRYYNPIRVGSEPTVHAVTDLYSGKTLQWKLVDGPEAAEHLRGANPKGQYIEVQLARPVPDGGEGRIRIDKTYADPKSYLVQADQPDAFVFERSLGIPRNSVVLPAGYELTACSVPAQVALEEDGRVRISFLHRTPGPALVRIEGRRLQTAAKEEVKTWPKAAMVEDRAAIQPPQRTSARLESRPNERAFQDREIVYYLQSPETHAFRLYHDYTETRPGMDRYLNIVRPGSRATDPSATLLDSGEALRVETLRGKEITERKIEIGEDVTDDTELVVIWFDPVKANESKRLRIWETYTDPGRYGINPKAPTELVWDRSFGRNRNEVVLPVGWWLTESSIPARVSLDDEDRVSLLFENDRPDVIDVLIRAQPRLQQKVAP